MELMRRSHSEVTYSSLCLPDNISARGLESIPNFYYRDDGLKLWNIISRFALDTYCNCLFVIIYFFYQKCFAFTSFVGAIVENYYPSDSDVHEDTELQDWISEIFTHGFLGNKASGIHPLFWIHSSPKYTDIFNVGSGCQRLTDNNYAANRVPGILSYCQGGDQVHHLGNIHINSSTCCSQ